MTSTDATGRTHPPHTPRLIINDDLPPDWQHRAACRNHPDKEMWFPIGNTGPALLQIEDAKAICNRRCPVVDECLRWALDTGSDFGVFGGMSEDERKSLKRRVVRAESRNRARAKQEQAAA